MDADDVVLGDIRALWQEADPPPVDLVDLSCFGLEMTTLGAEIMRAGERLEFAGARGEGRTRLVTFDGEHITVMIDIAPNSDGSVRLDGWITPPASHSIELRATGGTISTSSDSGGRFAFDNVGRGLAQLAVLTNGSVTTPAIVL